MIVLYSNSPKWRHILYAIWDGTIYEINEAVYDMTSQDDTNMCAQINTMKEINVFLKNNCKFLCSAFLRKGYF